MTSRFRSSMPPIRIGENRWRNRVMSGARVFFVRITSRRNPIQMTVDSVGPMTGAPGGVQFLGLEIDPVSRVMYALGSGGLSTYTELFTVDKATAVLTSLGLVDGAHAVLGGWGLAFGPAE